MGSKEEIDSLLMTSCYGRDTCKEARVRDARSGARGARQSRGRVSELAGVRKRPPRGRVGGVRRVRGCPWRLRGYARFLNAARVAVVTQSRKEAALWVRCESPMGGRSTRIRVRYLTGEVACSQGWRASRRATCLLVGVPGVTAGREVSYGGTWASAERESTCRVARACARARALFSRFPGSSAPLGNHAPPLYYARR